MTIRNTTTGVTYATITAALNALPSPLTAPVTLEDIDGATYSESLQLTTTRAYMVTIRAATHLRPTIEGGTSVAVNFAANRYTIEGFRIRNTTAGPGNRVLVASNAHTDRFVRRCLIEATGTGSDNNDAIGLNGGRVSFESCVFERARLGEGALVNVLGGSYEFTGCTFIQPAYRADTTEAGAAIEWRNSISGNSLTVRASIFRYRGYSSTTLKNAVLLFGTTNERDRWVGDGNIFARYTGVGATANHVAYVASPAITYTTLADWSAATGEDVESIESDAAFPHANLFRDEAARDFSITTSSVAYGAVLAAQEGLTTTDVTGRARPQGTASDIGAYEATEPRDWEALYAAEVASTWSTTLSSRTRGWVLLARIEGVGDGSGQWTFCSVVPAYGSNSTYKPWMVTLPEVLSERVDLSGGIPEAGSCTLQLVDVADTLTSLLRTESAEYTSVTEAVDATETEIEVGRNTGLNGLVIWLGSEAMKVTATASSPTRVTVTRGYLGTEATTHDSGDPVYLWPNFLEGRRFSVYLAPLHASSSTEERLVGTYVLERVAWDDALNAWSLSGSSQQRYLDRQAPIRPQTMTLVTPMADRVLCSTPGALRALWSDDRLFMQAEGEVLRLRDLARVFGASGEYPLTQYLIDERQLLGSKQAELEQGQVMRRVFLAGQDLRYSPGPSPSTSRSSGTWTQATHWVDLLLILLLSSADEADGLELVNRRTTGSDWSRSNFSSLPPGYGAGLPASLIDWSSWESVRNRTRAWTLPYFALGHEEPQSFAELIERHFLRPLGAYLSVDGGTLRLALARVPLADETAAATIDADTVLRRGTEAQVYLPRVSAQRDRARAIGAVVYRVGPQKIAGTFRNSDFGRTYGQRGWYGALEPTLTIDVPGGDPGMAEAYGQRASALLYRQHRPPLELEAEVDASLFPDATAGAVLAVSLAELPELASGVRGWTSVLAEVAERELRAEATRSIGGGDSLGVSLRLRLRRYGATVRLGRIHPAAHITSVSSATATVEANRYTQSDATDGLPTSDAAAFVAGDKVILVDRDGAVVAGTPETVSSVSSNTITLSGTFGGALAAGKVLVSAAVGDASTTQRGRYVYHADRGDQTVGSTTDALWRWGEP